MQTQPPCGYQSESAPALELTQHHYLLAERNEELRWGWSTSLLSVNIPFIFVGSVCVHKGDFTYFPHQVFQVLLAQRMQTRRLEEDQNK